MAVRERDQADIDLDRFVEIFDECMTSENPAVRKAFNNLLLVASIANSETRNMPVRQGPLRRILEDQRDILRRIERLETQQQNNLPGFGPVPPSTPWPNTTPPWTITCSDTTK